MLYYKVSKIQWQSLKDLILNPTKYMVAFGEFNVECAKAVLERHGIACYTPTSILTNLKLWLTDFLCQNNLMIFY